MAADPNSRRARLALSCSPDGTIEAVLRDDLRLASSGIRLAAILDSGSAQKAEMLLAALRDRDSVAGWQLNVPSSDAARPLYFAAAATGRSVLMLAAPDRDSVAALFDELAADRPMPEALGKLLHEQRGNLSASMNRDNHLYEELSRLNNDLINRERELARKSAALERLSAEKGRMVAIAAHDLRNPLTVIASYADLLRMDHAVEGQHLLYLEEISRSAHFMMELVEEMLDSSRLENGQIELDLQELDLVEAARHAATINRIRAERKEIAIDFVQETDRSPIRADPVKLRQIINNLVVNAVNFSPSHTTITIRVHDEPGRAAVTVEDQGIGIPQEKLTTIFEPFKTLGSGGTAGEKSTGLGLSIVKQLVALHGATLEVESEVGRGSRFRVFFPRAEP